MNPSSTLVEQTYPASTSPFPHANGRRRRTFPNEGAKPQLIPSSSQHSDACVGNEPLASTSVFSPMRAFQRSAGVQRQIRRAEKRVGKAAELPVLLHATTPSNSLLSNLDGLEQIMPSIDWMAILNAFFIRERPPN